MARGRQDHKTWLRRSARWAGTASLGLAAGFVAAFLLSRSVWLEMRVNVGHALPAAVVLALCSPRLGRKQALSTACFLLLESLAVGLVVLWPGFGLSALPVVPAALFRDGFHLQGLTLEGINRLLLGLLGIVNAGWIGSAFVFTTKQEGGS